MADNIIKLQAVSDLLDKHFFIPDYQRGYRWTGQQVKDLLKDLWDFCQRSSDPQQFYCLQPLVVRIMSDGEKISQSLDTGQEWLEVIDGQQRLVTIYLILSLIKRKNEPSGLYEIRFQREHTPTFLQDMVSANINDDSTTDRYHISHALRTIKGWFEDTQQEAQDKLRLILLPRPNENENIGNVRFIWYETVGEDPIKVFTRLNIGKISLTNSELIKAVLLNRSNFAQKEARGEEGTTSLERIHLKQQEIACEWDNIEYALQDDEFWLFLHEKGYDRPTRIDFIFELICDKELKKLTEDERQAIGTDDYKTFRFFYDRFQSGAYNITSCWAMVQKYFYTFREWYNDLRLYHYVGYLIACNDNKQGRATGIAWLMEQWEKAKDKEEFVEMLKKINTIGVDRLYKEDGSDKGLCKPILLFHNIQTVVDRNVAQQANTKYKLGTFYKFPFHLFKLEGWDVEHINSSTTNTEDDINTQKEWLCNVYLSVDEKTREEITSLFNGSDEAFTNGSDKASNDGFKALRDRCLKILNDDAMQEEEWTPQEKNQIGNYTLLDSSTNRSYGNAIFSGKRRVIISKDSGLLLPLPKLTRDGKLSIDESKVESASSSFVPPCTKQVFLKYYSPTIGNNNYWSKADAESYKKDIEKCIAEISKK